MLVEAEFAGRTRRAAKGTLYAVPLTSIAEKLPLSFDQQRLRFGGEAIHTRVGEIRRRLIGAKSQSVPFAGRGDALARLDSWIANLNGASKALLVAPAGRGKSTLLAHWVGALEQRPQIRVVHYPIGVSSGTNRLSDAVAELANQLAIVTHQPAHEFTAHAYVPAVLERGPTSDLQLVVVLDGLDELDKELPRTLFPSILAKNVRVLVSARGSVGTDAEFWQTRLGWADAAISTLEPLTEPQVAEVLDEMGPPFEDWARNRPFRTLLFEKSRGDPLTLAFWMQSLQAQAQIAQHLTPNALTSYLVTFEAGLRGVFRAWREEERRRSDVDIFGDPAVRTLLSLCAVAKAPLTVSALARAPGSSLKNAFDVEQAERLARRYIQRTGMHEFALQHPGMGDDLRDLLGLADVHDWEARLVTYCLNSIDELGRFAAGQDVLPEAAREAKYALLNVGAHLETTGGWKELALTLRRPRLRAHLALEGYPRVFLLDCERLQAHARRIQVASTMAVAVLARTTLRDVLRNPDEPALILVALRAGAISIQLATELASDLDRRAGRRRSQHFPGHRLATWQAMGMIAEYSNDSAFRKGFYRMLVEDIRFDNDRSDLLGEEHAAFIVDVGSALCTNTDFAEFEELYDVIDEEHWGRYEPRSPLISIWSSRCSGEWRARLMRDVEFIEDDQVRDEAILNLARSIRPREAPLFRRFLREKVVTDRGARAELRAILQAPNAARSNDDSGDFWDRARILREMSGAADSFYRLNIFERALPHLADDDLGWIARFAETELKTAGELAAVRRALVLRNHVPAIAKTLEDVVIGDVEAVDSALHTIAKQGGAEAARACFEAVRNARQDGPPRLMALSTIADHADLGLATNLLQYLRSLRARDSRSDSLRGARIESATARVLARLASSLPTNEVPRLWTAIVPSTDLVSPYRFRKVLPAFLEAMPKADRVALVESCLDTARDLAVVAAIVDVGGSCVPAERVRVLVDQVVHEPPGPGGSALLVSLCNVVAKSDLDQLIGALGICEPNDLARAKVALARRGAVSFSDALDAFVGANGTAHSEDLALQLIGSAPAWDAVWNSLSTRLFPLISSGTRADVAAACLARCPDHVLTKSCGDFLELETNQNWVRIVDVLQARWSSELFEVLLSRRRYHSDHAFAACLRSIARCVPEDCVDALLAAGRELSTSGFAYSVSLDDLYDEYGPHDTCDSDRAETLPQLSAALCANRQARIRRKAAEIALRELAAPGWLIFAKALQSRPDDDWLPLLIERLRASMPQRKDERGDDGDHRSWSAAVNQLVSLAPSARDLIDQYVRVYKHVPPVFYPHLPASKLSESIRQALHDAHGSRKHLYDREFWEIVPRLAPADTLLELVEEAAMLDPPTGNASALAALATRATQLNVGSAVVVRIVECAGDMTRADAVRVLAELSGWLLRAEGAEGLTRLIDAIAETTSWWI
jgi:hypothetical protein